MSLRRIFALIALAASAMTWHAGQHQLAETFLGPLTLMLAPVMGFFAAAVLVFNLPILGRPQPDSGFGLLSERQGHAFGAVVTGLFGALLIFIAVRGLARRAMPALGDGPDLVFLQSPLGFVLAFAVWASGGAAMVWLAWHLRPRRRRQP